MPIKELLSELRGILVITREEGAHLGVVSRIYLDSATAKISGLSFGSRRRRHGDHFVAAEAIVSIGRDVVFVTSEAAVTDIVDKEEPAGRSLKELQGMRVTTQNGEYLGVLVDLDVRQEDWSICELRLADDKRLPVEAVEITIGRDEILVPAAYFDKVTSSATNRPGFLGRLFGREAVQETTETIRRALRRNEPGSTRKTKPKPDA